MPLPKDYEHLSMEDSVEMALAGLDQYLEPADMALVTAIRKAARIIDKLDLEADGDKDANPAKSLQYHYMVTGGLEKLGGSVKARADIGLRKDKDKESKLAAVRGIRDGNKSGQSSAGRKPAGSAGRKTSTRKAS